MQSIPSEIKQQKKNLRCQECNKKLKLIYFTCKCDRQFCIVHQNPHSHKCDYDYKKEKSKELITNNPKLTSKLIIN